MPVRPAGHQVVAHVAEVVQRQADHREQQQRRQAERHERHHQEHHAAQQGRLDRVHGVGGQRRRPQRPVVLAVHVLEQPAGVQQAVDGEEVEVVPQHQAHQLQRHPVPARAARRSTPSPPVRPPPRPPTSRRTGRWTPATSADLAARPGRAQSPAVTASGRPQPRRGKQPGGGQPGQPAEAQVDDQEAGAGRRRTPPTAAASAAPSSISWSPRASRPAARVHRPCRPSGPRLAPPPARGPLVADQHRVQHLGAQAVDHQAEAGAQGGQRHQRVAVVDQRQVGGVAQDLGGVDGHGLVQLQASGWPGRSRAG